MKKMMSLVAVALLVAGSVAMACDTCGCKEKKAEAKKAECAVCPAAKSCDKCTADKSCDTCTAKKAEAKKAEAKKAEAKKTAE